MKERKISLTEKERQFIADVRKPANWDAAFGAGLVLLTLGLLLQTESYRLVHVVISGLWSLCFAYFMGWLKISRRRGRKKMEGDKK